MRRMRWACIPVMLLALLLSVIAVNQPAHAAVKQTKKRAVAIVFDNSASMYGIQGEGDLYAWCRATYAMEVFTGMANDEDEVRVYPMNEVEADGMTFTSRSPMIFRKGSDVRIIERIFTSFESNGYRGTPIEAIDDACSGLKSMEADEKWLVILTDGTTFQENSNDFGEATQAKLSERLSGRAGDFNILYLGIGEEACIPEISGSKVHIARKAASSAEVLTNLTEMCNAMYGRDVLPESNQKGNVIDFDIRLSKLIFLVQGDDVTGVTLKDSGGNTVQLKGSTQVRHADEIDEEYKYFNGYPCDPRVDESLNGVIVTYEDLAAGSYEYSVDGTATSIGIYYEPDVDLQMYLLKDGTPLDAKHIERLGAGEYELVYGLIDENGEFTTSPLLGHREFELYNAGRKVELSAPNDNGTAKLVLKKGDTLELRLVARFLENYTIEKDNSALGVGIVEIGNDPNELAYKLTAPEKQLVLRQSDSWKPLELQITMGGEKLTKEQLDMAASRLRVDAGDLGVGKYEVNYENSTIYIPLDRAEGTTTGRKKITAETVLPNHDGEEVSLEAAEFVHVQRYPAWLIPLLVVLGILAVAATVCGILQYIFTRLRLPKEIAYDQDNSEFVLNGHIVEGIHSLRPREQGKETGRFTIVSPETELNLMARCTITMDLVACDKRYVKSFQRHATVTKISVSQNCTSVDINGQQYEVVNGQLLLNGEPVPQPLTLRIGNNSQITLEGKAFNAAKKKMQSFSDVVTLRFR